MKRLMFAVAIIFLLPPGKSATQWDSPVLIVHPRQLAASGNTFEGLRVKMEVAFFYRSILQEDSLFQKCTVEGKFRESGNIDDEVVLFNVLFPNGIFLRYMDILKEGSRLTLSGIVRKAKGPWTRLEVFDVSAGWEADTSANMKEGNAEIPFMKLFIPDSSGPGMNGRPDSSRKAPGGRTAGRKPDSSLRKSKQDSSWVK